MDLIQSLLTAKGKETTLHADEQNTVAALLSERSGGNVYAPSITTTDGQLIALARKGRDLQLLVLAGASGLGLFTKLATEKSDIAIGGATCTLGVIRTSEKAAALVRERLTWTAPSVQGLKCSAGLGDRLGLATPGHVRAVAGTNVVPYFAQQSIREMTRTQRTPAQVMDAATWGVLQSGWRSGFGSDADHLKETQDIDVTAAVGFTMFTIDPGDHVVPEADTLDASALAGALENVPWAALETTAKDTRHRYVGKTITLEGGTKVDFDEDTLARAAIKYGGAVAHTVTMYRHLEKGMGNKPFELEVSVDETATPTSTAEHYFIASELKRLGVKWVGLAPRFVGEFEKGIDYKGDLAAFERTFAEHVAIAKTFGPYKMSIHSGSDKFAVYPIAARIAGPLVHLKTAGTSYLEALRVAARKAPALFREILTFAFARFEEDRRTYHISARVEAIPRSENLADNELEPKILDVNDGRQLLHVTFGSVLTDKKGGTYRFRDRLLEMLIDNEEEHYNVLASHLGKHVAPFAQ